MKHLCRFVWGNETALKCLLASWLMLRLTLPFAVWANPSGEQVVSGSASFNRTGNTLAIAQGSDRAIIDWQSFSIAAGESTNFLQPSSTSAVLNRVISNDPSQIFGTLTANGRVYLVNQNGILVGASGVIDTNGFVASTLDVANEAFLAGGDLTFLGDSDGAVLNLGKINAVDGDVLLIAHDVRNDGEITAANGSAALASGSEVLVRASGDERVFILAGTVDGSVVNSGLIDAASAELKALGDNEFALAVNNEGAVRATAVEERGGRIWLVADRGTVENSGTLTASRGDSGGEVQVLGDRVALTGDARVDVSGAAGGGTVLIGGDFQGANPEVKNASKTFVGADADITADALQAGDGGKVIVWSDDATQFYGDISAMGGVEIGDGGFVEVSGKEALDFRGFVNSGAVNGEAGSLLLDPRGIMIMSGGFDPISSNPLPFATDPSALYQIDPVTITAITDGGTNLTLQANNDIDIMSAITSNNPSGNGGGLTFQAGKSITINAPIVSDNGNLSFTVNDPTANVTYRLPGAANFTNTSLLDAGTGNVTISMGTNAAGSGAITTGHIIANKLSIMHMGPTTGAVTGRVELGETDLASSMSILTFSARDIASTANTSIAVGGTATIVSSGGDIILTDINNDFSNLRVTGNGGNVSITDSNDLVLGVSSASSLTVTTLGAISTNGKLTVAGLGDFKTLNDAGKGITIGNSSTFGSLSAQSRNAADDADAGGAIALAPGTSTLLQALATTGNITLTAASGATLSQDATSTLAAAGLDLQGAGGSHDLLLGTNDIATLSGNTGTIKFRDDNGFDIGATSTFGVTATALTLETGGSVTESSFMSVGGLELLGAGGNFTLDIPFNNIPLLAGNTGSAEVYTFGVLQIGTLNTAGMTTSGDLLIQAHGAIGQTAPVVAAGLTLLTPVDQILLNHSDNDVNALQVTSDFNLDFTDADGFDIAGIGVSGDDVSLSAGGDITQSGALTGVNRLSVITTGSVDLDETGIANEIVSLGAVSAGTGIAIADSDADLTIDGDVAATAGNILIRADGGNLTLADTRTLTVAGAADIYLVAGTDYNFINNDSTPGTPALVTDSGRFIIYADNFSDTVTGGLTGETYMGRTYAADPPAGVSETGNLFFYNDRATLTFTAADKTRTYGSANPGLTYTLSGLLSVHSAADAFTGDPALATAATATSNVGAYAIGIANGTLTNERGYLFSFADGTLTIDKALLTLTTTDVTKTYDGTLTAAGTALVDGTSGTQLFGSDSLTGGSFAFTDANAGINKTVTVSGVTVNDGNSGGNYNVSYVDNINSIINKAALSITANDDNTIYDASAYSGGNGVVYSGFVNSENSSVLGGSLSFGGTAQGAVDAGNYLITPLGLTSGNYTIGFVDGTLTIDKALLTLTSADVTKTYDGTLTAAGSALVDGSSGTQLFGSDSLTGGSFAFADANAGSNKTVTVNGVTVNDGNGGSNYNVSYVDNISSTINKAALSLSTSDVTKTYDGTLVAAGSATVVGGTLYANASNGGAVDSLTGGSFAFTDANAGSGKTVTISTVTVNDGNGGGNYNVSYVDNINSIINQAALSLSTSDVTKTYDGTLSAAGSATVVGGTLYANASNGGAVDSLSGGSFAFTDANAGSNKTVTVSGVTVNDGNGGGNYNVSYVDNINSLINQAALSVTANDDNTTYDASAYSGGNGVVYSGFVNSEDSSVFGGSLSYGGTAQGAVDAGNYLITPLGLTSGNYVISFVDGTLTVNKALLTYVANSMSREYGDANPALSGTLSGFVGSEGLGDLGGLAIWSTPAVIGSNVGSYSVAGSGYTSANYNFAQSAGNATALTVNKATLTYTADEAARIYGDGNPELTGSIAGFKLGQDVSVLGGSAQWQSTALASNGVGSYAVTGAGYVSANYDFAQAPANATALTILPATLTYVADAVTRGYGEENPPLTGTLIGMKNGEALSAIASGGAWWTTGADSGSPVGTYSIYGGGLTVASGNYRAVIEQAAANAEALTVRSSSLVVDGEELPIVLIGGDFDLLQYGSQLLLTETGNPDLVGLDEILQNDLTNAMGDASSLLSMATGGFRVEWVPSPDSGLDQMVLQASSFTDDQVTSDDGFGGNASELPAADDQPPTGYLDW